MNNKDLNFKERIPYEVDFQYLNTQVDFFLTTPDAENRKEQFYNIIEFFKDKKFVDPSDASFMRSFRVKCENFQYTVECNNLIARQILSVLLNLQDKGEAIYHSWYLYDYDRCNEMPQFIHSFFIAGSHRIVLENVRISSSWMDECDSNVLIESSVANCPDSSLPLWSNMEADLKAETTWYYQKFYQETIFGQLQSLKKKPKSKKMLIPIANQHPSDDHASLLCSIDKSLKWLICITVILLLKIFF
ncbi:hypothetical protein [Parachlamydia acanthamoebae]|uniref:hypothetical protein n=1 Tax=Parachlamydia acanthamoebae TaxID=83552 RepID=UPI00075158EB|nr:hypothetical protein [Parachlamydia acanthamoebae]